jgi:flavin prenyltransferase
MTQKLVVAVTGASGMALVRQLIRKSPFEVVLVASEWGEKVYARECGPFEMLADEVHAILDNRDLAAPIASGSVDTAGMIVAPCSANTLGEIAAGAGQHLITRAAHCHLKERKPLVLCLRETPLTLIDLDNARKVTRAGGVVMPVSPPFFMTEGRNPAEVSMLELMDLFADRVLKLFGRRPEKTWEHLR